MVNSAISHAVFPSKNFLRATFMCFIMFPSCLGAGLKLFCHTSKAEIRHLCEVKGIMSFSECSSTWLHLIYTKYIAVSAGPHVVLSILFNNVYFMHLSLDGTVHAENFQSFVMFLALIETKF